MTIPDDFPLLGQVVSHGEHGGIPWVTSETLFGASNGYVRLPDGHPWLDEAVDVETDVPCGEITYRSGNWIGFDSLHHWQHWPGMPHWWPIGGHEVNMDHSKVTAWAELLAIEAHDQATHARTTKRDSDAQGQVDVAGVHRATPSAASPSEGDRP